MRTEAQQRAEEAERTAARAVRAANASEAQVDALREQLRRVAMGGSGDGSLKMASSSAVAVSAGAGVTAELYSVVEELQRQLDGAGRCVTIVHGA